MKTVLRFFYEFITDIQKNPFNNVFLDKLNETIIKLHNSNNLEKHEHKSLINKFFDIMYSNSLKPCITEPIRITSNFRPSLIDNIFTNMRQNT